MMMMKRLTGWLAAALCVTAVAGTAFAQSADERAANYAERAAAAYAEGDLNGAIGLYEQAFRFVPDPSFAYNLGAMYSEAGNVAASYNYFTRYVELFPGASDRAEIEAYLEELLQQVQTSYTLVEAGSRPEGAEVYLIGEDGAERYLGVTPLEWWVDPGSLTFEFRLEGYESAQDTMRGVAGVRVSPQARLEEIEEEVVEVTTPNDELTQSPEAETSGGGSLAPIAYGALGLGVVGLGAGTYFMLDFYSRQSAIDNHGQWDTPAEYDQAVADANRSGSLGPVLLVAGGVFAAAGVGILVLSSGDDDDTDTAATFAPLTRDTWGLQLSGRF